MRIHKIREDDEGEGEVSGSDKLKRKAIINLLLFSVITLLASILLWSAFISCLVDVFEKSPGITSSNRVARADISPSICVEFPMESHYV